MEDWIPRSVLLSEDFELIRSEILKTNYSYSKTQKSASYYLNKVFKGPDRAKCSTKALLLAVYCATTTDGNDVDTMVPDVVLKYTATDWLSRLRKFKTVTRKTQVVRDCVYQLFRVGKLTPEDLIQDPMLVAALAHRLSVHELMSYRLYSKKKHNRITHLVDGTSMVAEVLAKHKGQIRLDFLESLYSAYKDDFQYIISPEISEFTIMLEKGLKRCLKFLQNTRLRFPTIDAAFANLHWPITTGLLWYKIEPETQKDMNGFKKAMAQESAQVWSGTKGKTKKRQIKTLKQMTLYIKFLNEKYNKLKLPVLGNSTFPFWELPTEIAEMIYRYSDIDSIIALRMLSSDMKSFVNPARLTKIHFPLKFHMLEQSGQPKNAKLPSWETIYHQHISSLRNWNKGKSTLFSIEGRIRAMDDNFLIGTLSKPGYHRYFWVKWNDSTLTQHQFDASTLQDRRHSGLLQAACVIDSAENNKPPTIALAVLNSVEIFVGGKLRHSFNGPRRDYLTEITAISRKNKLFIDNYVFHLDERYRAEKLFKEREYLLDVNPLNGMYLSTISECNYLRNVVWLYSPSNERIGNLWENCFGSVRYKSGKFLDEHRFACVSTYGDIDIADIRKMGTPFLRLPTTEFSQCVLDPVNRRAITLSPGPRPNVVSVWDLSSYQCNGGFYFGKPLQHAVLEPQLHVSTNYLAYQNNDKISVLRHVI